MSVVQINLELSTNEATPYLRQLIAALEDRTGLHTRIAERAEVLTRKYLAGIATKRHRTAQRLGATPTGILSRAAESAESSATADGAYLTLRPAEVLGRAFRHVEIVPRNGKKWLTIPIARATYGKRAGEFPDLQFIRPRGKTYALLVKRGPNGNVLPYFLLVRKVTQKQDRTLLPSDDAYLAEMEAAAKGHILEGTN